MLIYLVVVPIIIAVLLYLSPFERITKLLALLVQICLVGAAFYLFYLVDYGVYIQPIGHYTYSGLTITLKADFLSAAFILITSFIYLLIVVFMFNDNQSRIFWFLLFVWQAALMGIFLSGDLFNIFVLTEVATTVIVILLMFDKEKRSLYDGVIYFMINIVAIQFFLLGLGYLYRVIGIFDFETALAYSRAYDRSNLVLPYALIMTFVALKCAFVPVYNWLPRAHGTPGALPAVSAVLSGLHIKSAVYMFLRVQELFEGMAMYEFYIVVGIVSAIAGFMLALAQKDIKLILAYHTISQIGLIMVGLNINHSENYIGGLYHMFNHAFFKSLLFLCAGIIAKAYGSRNIYMIRGVFRKMPAVGFATLLGALGITGAPFFNGSISKYFIAYGQSGMMFWLLLFINLGTVISFIKFTSMLWGKPENDVLVHKDRWQQASILTLGLLCFCGGLWGLRFISFFFGVDLTINFWGYVEKSGMYFISLAIGYLIYRYYLPKSAMLKLIGSYELGFKGMCAALGVFFAIMLIVTGVYYA